MIIGNKPTNPGDLRTQITLLKRTVTTGDGGFQTSGTTTIGMAWARWENVHGSEVWNAAALNAVAPATVLIRYNSQVDQSCLVQKGSDVYEVVSVDDIRERHEYMELKVRRITEA